MVPDSSLSNRSQFDDVTADLPTYEKAIISTNLDSQVPQYARTGRSRNSHSSSAKSSFTSGKDMNDNLSKMSTKQWISPPPPPPPPMSKEPDSKIAQSQFLPCPPPRTGVSTSIPSLNSVRLPADGVSPAQDPSIISPRPSSGSETPSLERKLHGSSEVFKSVENSEHDSGRRYSGHFADSNPASQWSMIQVAAWLRLNSFSEEWVITFENLRMEGSKFWDLAVGPTGRGNMVAIIKRVYPELARVCTSRGVVWNQAVAREEGRRLRNLLVRDAEAAVRRWHEEAIVEDRIADTTQGEAFGDDSNSSIVFEGRTSTSRPGTFTPTSHESMPPVKFVGSRRSPKKHGARNHARSADAESGSGTESDDGLFTIAPTAKRGNTAARGPAGQSASKPSLSLGSQMPNVTTFSAGKIESQPEHGTLFGGSLWAVRATPDQILKNLSTLFPDLDAQRNPKHQAETPIRGQIIGAGVNSSVHVGLRVEPLRVIVIKQIRTEQDENTNSSPQGSRKAELMSSLIDKFASAMRFRHRNLVEILGYHRDKGNSYLSLHLEYVSGGTIETCLRTYGRLEESVIRSVTRQLLAALCYLHQSDHSYGEIKAGNILLDLKGVCKLTIPGTVLTGEFLAGAVGGHGAADDIWHLGCIVLEMYSGRRAITLDPNTGIDSKRTPCIPEDIVSRASVEGLDFMADCFTVNRKHRPSGINLSRASRFSAPDPSYNFLKTALFASLGGPPTVAEASNTQHDYTRLLPDIETAAASSAPIDLEELRIFPVDKQYSLGLDSMDRQEPPDHKPHDVFFSAANPAGSRSESPLTDTSEVIQGPIGPAAASASMYAAVSSPRIMTAADIMRKRRERDSRRGDASYTHTGSASQPTPWSTIGASNQDSQSWHQQGGKTISDLKGHLSERFRDKSPPPTRDTRSRQRPSYIKIPPPPPTQGWKMQGPSHFNIPPPPLPPPSQNERPVISATYIPNSDSFGPGVGIPPLHGHPSINDSSVSYEAYYYPSAPGTNKQRYSPPESPVSRISFFEDRSRSPSGMRDEGYQAGGRGGESDEENLPDVDDADSVGSADDADDDEHHDDVADIDALLLDWTTLSTDEVKAVKP
ncbi:hypothetical protein LTR84_003942 [Exophiala bonariae]|uniref:mitogen-activated protein kinase n=1 Tax=Exophiala bonariae TaxID=1690606 RepID=A0AAV9N570_9EURO|nr:hypothetical protein LTR84_003942 [Exophiala bonariae]